MTVRTIHGGAFVAIALFCLSTSCDRRAPPTGEGVKPSTRAVGTAVVAQDSTVTAEPAGTTARRLVGAWNDALDRHDVAALEGLYGERVRFYGRDLSRRAVLDAKRVALGEKSTFHQTIVGEVTVVATGDGSVSATFTKRSGSSGKMRDVRGVLVFRTYEAGAIVIVEETDTTSEARKAGAESTTCEAVAARVTSDLPAVKRVVLSAKLAADKSGGLSHFGGVGPIEDADGFTAGLGTHTAERFEAEVWYSVDHKGHLTVSVLGEDQHVPDDAARLVESACNQ